MKLLQITEREAVSAKEKEQIQRKALEMSEEITALTKSFNLVKSRLSSEEDILLEEHLKFKEEKTKEQMDLEDRLSELKTQCETALKPLREKEKEIDEKTETLKKKEEDIYFIEKDLRVREDNASKLETACDTAYAEISKKENAIVKKEKDLEARRTHFNASRSRTEKQFEIEKQKLRDWLEVERAKLRKK